MHHFFYNRHWVRTRGLAVNISMRNIRAAWANVVGFYTLSRQTFHQRLAMPYQALAWRSDTAKHHQFLFLHSLLYSTSPQAWDRKCHIMYKIYTHIHHKRWTVLLKNYAHCTFCNDFFLLSKPRTHLNNHPATMSYTASNQIRKTTLPIRSEEWPMELTPG